jgi:hypothetical protein
MGWHSTVPNLQQQRHPESELVRASLPQPLASDSFIAGALGVRQCPHGDRCN